MAKEGKFQREEVVPVSGATGLSPIYHTTDGKRAPRVEYDRRTRWLGILVAGLLAGALALVYVWMLLSSA